MRNVFVVFLIVYPSFSFAFPNMTNGVGINDSNKDALWGTSIPYAVARQGQRAYDDNEYVTGFIEIGDSVYSISSKPSLLKTVTTGRKVDAGWPLTRWPHETIPPEITQRLAQERAFVPEPTPVIGDRTQGVPYSGCLSQIPLRYGDVDGNGSNELVILADKDIIFFSVEQQKVIFQLRWIDERYSGYFDQEDMPLELTDPKYPQYKDPYSNGPLYKGLRVYAKLYLGEFNGNQTHDIVVWYKVYESNMIGGTPGFSKVSDTFKHYERITALTEGQTPTGEYLPMSTADDTIRQWLTTANLTWKKGYPDISECAADAGKPIPEMSDPLLNDPEVLQ